MALDQRKYEHSHKMILRDIRPTSVRIADWLRKPTQAFSIFFMLAGSIYFFKFITMAGDLVFLIALIYFWWLTMQDRTIAFKMPYGAKWKDKNNEGPGRSGKGEGILYLGNVDETDEEVWFSNSDARTHILYLGTTGSGKTEGLKSMVTNAMTWGSGFVYIDGKADTDLWSSLSSLVRRFGRDDDLLVLNYMTGNSDAQAPSNTMNPFSSGSASYLTNMLVSLMPDAEGDNAMWKERAVSLVGSLMPAMTWMRDKRDMPLAIGTIRDYLNLNNIIKLSRDEDLPEDIRISLKSYLDTLPGYVDDAFDDEGKEKPAGPDQPAYDTTTPRQQHGYLSMQFTRALQSLGDDYGYIFDTQAADVDMVDVVLNRRILVVLIPALEKSSDEVANLGKIVAATIKGMMGSTLGSTVEGESATVIENKPTQSATPFMTVFDEVGYYAAQGMAVMAAQARSLGFSLIFSAQDLPAMEKRVREEARSITANCNIKIFGKLEDPTQTKEFFEKTVGSAIVAEASGFQLSGGSGGAYMDSHQAGIQIRPRASYDGLRAFKEGEAVIAFGEMVVDTKVFYSNPGHAKAMRVTRFMSLPPPDEVIIKHASVITKVRDLMVHKTWTAVKADVAVETPEEIDAMAKVLAAAKKKNELSGMERGMAALVSVFALDNDIEEDKESKKQIAEGSGRTPPPVTSESPQAAQQQQSPISPFAKKPADPPVQSTPQDTAPAQEPQEQKEQTRPPLFTPPAKEEAGNNPTPDKTGTSADGDNNNGGNPMSFFGGGGSQQTENEGAEPPPPTPASSPPQEKAQEPPPVQKEDDKTAAAPNDTAEKTAPVSWKDLMQEQEATGNQEQTSSPAATPEESPKKTAADDTNISSTAPSPVVLDQDTEDTIKQAAQTVRQAIFRNKDDDRTEGDT